MSTKQHDDGVMSWHNLLLLLAVIAAYVLLGGVVFHVLESTTPNDKSVILQAQKFLAKYKDVASEDLRKVLERTVSGDVLAHIHRKQNSDLPDEHFSQWSLINSVFFATTLITTIGYGDLCPNTSEGRFFVVIYGILGIPVFMLAVSQLGIKALAALESLSTQPPSLFEALPSIFRHARNVQFIRALFVTVGGIVMCVIMPSLIFAFIEGWGVGESIYYAFVTLSTVGFGDFISGIQEGVEYPLWYLCFRQLWLFVGLVWLSTLYTKIQEELYMYLNRGSLTKSQSFSDFQIHEA